MKNRLLISLIVIAVAAVTITASLRPKSEVGSKHLTEQEHLPELISYPVPLYKIAKKISLEELISIDKTHDINLYLPTKMPGDVRLIEIYYSPPVILLSYSDREVSDYRYDNVTIEFSTYPSAPPPMRQLKLMAKEPSYKIFNVNGAVGILIENARWGYPELQELYGPSPFAYFWLGNRYYAISVVPPTSSDQLIEIVGSMKPLRG